MTAPTALAGAVALSAYLNAKYHIAKDLSHMYYQHRGARYQAQLKAQSRINIWSTFSDNAFKFADKPCIWYSDPSTTPPSVHEYTWREAREYACQYAQWFLKAGVQPGDCVGFYLQNSPDFVLGWLGLLAIGCYPAMINYNLVGGALVHCVKIAECKVLLVDEDFKERVLGNDELRELGVSMHVVDGDFKTRISRVPVKVPSADYTKDVDEKTKVALRYTRYVNIFTSMQHAFQLTRRVAQRDIPKVSWQQSVDITHDSQPSSPRWASTPFKRMAPGIGGTFVCLCVTPQQVPPSLYACSCLQHCA